MASWMKNPPKNTEAIRVIIDIWTAWFSVFDSVAIRKPIPSEAKMTTPIEAQSMSTPPITGTPIPRLT